MDDLISRQALCKYALNQKDKSITPNDIMRFPSAQPETHDKRTETHSCDCISRQSAIDAVYKCDDIFVGDMPVMVVKADAYEALAQLPSAQPDLSGYLDKLWKAAYERGKAEAQQRWISCSERLPENGHYYLWCSDMGSVQSDYYWDGFENGMKYGYNIVAWMPLPEPYAERRTDDESI